MTWGTGPHGWGNDIAPINDAIAEAFARGPIDHNRIALGGFSDGASYALSLGLANGDEIQSVIAFSPGFIVKAIGHGRPNLFIAHGREDPVLPIATASDLFVRQLQHNGYTVDYRQFAGRHEIPPNVCSEAMAWLRAKFQRR